MSTTRKDLIDDYDIDPRLAASSGPRETLHRRLLVQKAECPHHILASHAGADTPRYRGFLEDREDVVEWPSSAHVGDQIVHLHQRVAEHTENPLEDETVGWTVVRLTEDSVVLRNQPDWSRRIEVDFSEFSERFEAEYLPNGEPRFGY